MISSTERQQSELRKTDNHNQDQNPPGTGDQQKLRTRKAISQAGRGKLGTVSQLFINISFIVALLLSVACLLLSAIYLFKFLASTNEGINSTIQSVGTNASFGTTEVIINGRLVMGRIALLSCGILVGVSFGFLGFALFLLGIKESIDVDLDTDTYKAKFARMSPGVLIIICSAILIGVCATRQTPFWYENAIPASGNTRQDGNRSDSEGSEVSPNQNNHTSSRELPPQNKTLTKP